RRLDLVLAPRLPHLERCRHVEDRAAVLDRRDTPRGEALAVTQAVDEVDDRRLQVAGQDEVAVDGVRVAVLLDRAPRGDERLREHLAAEDAAAADVAVAAAIDVVFDLLEVEELEQVLYGVAHGWNGSPCRCRRARCAGDGDDVAARCRRRVAASAACAVLRRGGGNLMRVPAGDKGPREGGVTGPSGGGPPPCRGK